MLMALPREYTTRLQAHRLEVNSFLNSPDIPVFVCTIAFPTIPCPLLVFEPKYRLLVRRAIESGTRRFGMAACLKQPNGTKR
jgi:Lon protease-like protein